jgi:hypothetical protein
MYMSLTLSNRNLPKTKTPFLNKKQQKSYMSKNKINSIVDITVLQ